MDSEATRKNNNVVTPLILLVDNIILQGGSLFCKTLASVLIAPESVIEQLSNQLASHQCWVAFGYLGNYTGSETYAPFVFPGLRLGLLSALLLYYGDLLWRDVNLGVKISFL